MGGEKLRLILSASKPKGIKIDKNDCKRTRIGLRQN